MCNNQTSRPPFLFGERTDFAAAEMDDEIVFCICLCFIPGSGVACSTNCCHHVWGETAEK